ncbi:egg cell-secreted protein 1.3-like [Telopea speciosissima]|uniref:egg cell-secreted protein 1.3-like n=1 Tax=Telopea speciosissima TaxID=54955 RepID=UPI001CC335A8|nr:egg cell-secreted protein 1.3-like [Telopea speciosissima]
MALNNLVTLLLVMSCVIGGVVTMVDARELPPLKPGQGLAARLESHRGGGGGGEGGGGMVECWDALLELRSCTNEIIVFLLDGEAYLGLDCCRAIRVITRQCWPTMLTNLGFTAEEGDILRGYCDASSSPSPTQSPAPSPLFSVPPPAALISAVG